MRGDCLKATAIDDTEGLFDGVLCSVHQPEAIPPVPLRRYRSEGKDGKMKQKLVELHPVAAELAD